jgi:hypothetical protein
METTTALSDKKTTVSRVAMKITYGNKSSEIEFPVTKETNKSYRVLIDGCNFWMHKSTFNTAYKPDCAGFWGALNSPADIQKIIDRINLSISQNSDALIPVIKKGKGPTDKSAKYEFFVRSENEDSKRRTFTLPISQIIEESGKLYAPAWLLKNKIAEAQNRMSSKRQNRNTPQSVLAAGSLKFLELRKCIEEEFVKLALAHENEQTELRRLNVLMNEYLIFIQIYVRLFPDVLSVAKEKFEEFNFPHWSTSNLRSTQKKSVEIIYSQPEFQDWLKEYKQRVIRVEENQELINQFNAYIKKSKSKIALCAVEKLESNEFSRASEGHYGIRYEYHIRRCEFILLLPEFGEWKMKLN